MAAKPRILLVNPNSTQAFTHAMKKSLEAFIDIEIAAITTADGPRAINSTATSIASAHEASKMLLARPQILSSASGIVVACFSDHPLVPLLREVLPDPKLPVIGIFEAACVTASLLGRRFGIVTTDKRWEPLLEDGLRVHGYAEKCVAVRSSGLGVLELESAPQDRVIEVLSRVAKDLVEEDGAEVIVLGCAGMSGLQEAIQKAVGPKVPIVDGVQAAVQLVAGMARQKLFTSGSGLYATAQ